MHVPQVLVQCERAGSDQIPLSAFCRVGSLSVSWSTETQVEQSRQGENEGEEMHVEVNTEEDKVW